MNSGAMNMAQMARAINNIKTFPIVTTRTFGTRTNGQGLEQVQNGPIGYAPVQQPVMLLPYGSYIPPSYMYVTQPVYYGLPQPVAAFSTFTPNTSKNYRRQGPPFNGQSVNQKYSYSTGSEIESEDDQGIFDYDSMTALELYNMIKTHLSQFSRARLSWLNKLFTKVVTPEEFLRALEIFDAFHTRLISITPETGTLLIKAACRAGEPEKALALLKAIDRVRFWPTLGGIHYLMINFSLKKDTASVKQTFQIAKIRDLKPTVRTYQILIRECVDNGLIDDALQYMEEAEAAKVEPNRVTYNILMNGLRMTGKANEILALRKKMDQHKLEINDTTVKFTTLAYVMLQDLQSAIKEFKSYDYQDKFEAFCKKFFEVTDEPDATQKKCVVDLFEALQSQGLALPDAISTKLAEVKSSL